MPKPSNSKMYTPVQVAPRPMPTSRSIKSFDAPAPGGGAPKHADQIKSSEKHGSGSIDPTQQHY
jgi:hypothetical protein